MTYLKTRDTVYNYEKIYYVNYDNFIYRLIVDKKTRQGYMFYCDGTFYDLCTINFDVMNVTYKDTTLDILEAEVDTNGAFRFLGEVSSFEDLPKNANNGDIYQVPPDKEYVWNGEEWILLGFNMDLSAYATLEYVKAQDKINADNIALNAEDIKANETLIAQENSERKTEISRLEEAINKTHVLVITLTDNNDGTYTSDTDYETLAQAYTNNQIIIVRLEEGVLPLMSAEINTSGASFTFGYTKIGTDGEYITTMSVHYLHTNQVGNIEAKDEWLEETEVEEYLKTSGGTLSGNLSMGANAILDVQKLHIDGQAPLYFGQVIEKATPNKPRLTGVVNSNAAAFVKSDSQVDYVPLFIGTPTDTHHATTKEYVDGIANSKLTAIKDTANDDRLYGVHADGTQKMYPVAESLTTGAVPVRTAEGAIYVEMSDSPEEHEAVNISYLESAFTRKQDVFGDVTQENGDYTVTLLGDEANLVGTNYSMQFGADTFAITNTVNSKYLIFDNSGKLALNDADGPILPTAPQHLVVKKYVDDVCSTKLTATNTTDSCARVYAVSKEGEDALFRVSELCTDLNTVALRTATGTLEVATPTKDTEAATKKYVDDKLNEELPLSGGTISGDLSVTGKVQIGGTLSVTGSAACIKEPVNGVDLCNKQYVDGKISSIFSYDAETKTLTIKTT